MKRPIALTLTLAALAATAGCGSRGSFEAGPGTAPLPCMRHQKHTTGIQQSPAPS